MIAFRQLHDTASGAFTYLLAHMGAHTAVLVDPVREHTTLYLALLEELQLNLAYVLETHEHEDHVSAQEELRAACGMPVAASTSAADVRIGHGDVLRFGPERVLALATPGHTLDSISYLWRDRVLTGDSLLIGSCGRTDLPGGDPGQLYDSLVRRLLTLPDETLVYPGRDTQGRRVSCVGEEREHNACISGRSRDEFVTLMDQRRGPPTPPSPSSPPGLGAI